MKTQKVCKFIQKQLVDKIFKSPISQKRWSEKLNEISFDWKDAYLSPLKSSLSTRLRYFQYRLLHRILGVNEYTCKIGLIDSNLCSFCSLSVETIPHLFWDCPVTHKFIVDLQMHVLDNIPIDRISFLFGSAKLTRHYNFVILYAKYFIFSVKM